MDRFVAVSMLNWSAQQGEKSVQRGNVLVTKPNQ
jgi:hypothetical protein